MISIPKVEEEEEDELFVICWLIDLRLFYYMCSQNAVCETACV